MAAADYRLCDKCGQKAFYDANLAYECHTANDPIPADECIRGSPGLKLQYLGDWSVLCRTCAREWRCEIVPMQPASAK